MIPPRSPPERLVGKLLPDLDELNLQVNSNTTRGKRILVCFWRMGHHESRDCIRQLAARSKELANRGIVIVGVQIWIRNELQLRRWLARNRVGFAVSMLPDEWKQQPEQRATYRFALQSRVPWLILTDTEHIVRAEGFGLDALDEEIRKTE